MTARPAFPPHSARDRLIGIYDSQVAFGSRASCWSGPPDHAERRSIVLERQPGADTAGYAGLEDEVIITGALYSRSILSTLLGVGSELDLPPYRQQ